MAGSLPSYDILSAWSAKDVFDWLNQTQLSRYAVQFLDSNIDGVMLMELTYDQGLEMSNNDEAAWGSILQEINRARAGQTMDSSHNSITLQASSEVGGSDDEEWEEAIYDTDVGLPPPPPQHQQNSNSSPQPQPFQSHHLEHQPHLQHQQQLQQSRAQPFTSRPPPQQPLPHQQSSWPPPPPHHQALGSRLPQSQQQPNLQHHQSLHTSQQPLSQSQNHFPPQFASQYRPGPSGSHQAPPPPPSQQRQSNGPVQGRAGGGALLHSTSVRQTTAATPSGGGGQQHLAFRQQLESNVGRMRSQSAGGGGGPSEGGALRPQEPNNNLTRLPTTDSSSSLNNGNPVKSLSSYVNKDQPPAPSDPPPPPPPAQPRQPPRLPPRQPSFHRSSVPAAAAPKTSTVVEEEQSEESQGVDEFYEETNVSFQPSPPPAPTTAVRGVPVPRSSFSPPVQSPTTSSSIDNTQLGGSLPISSLAPILREAFHQRQSLVSQSMYPPRQQTPHYQPSGMMMAPNVSSSPPVTATPPALPPKVRRGSVPVLSHTQQLQPHQLLPPSFNMQQQQQPHHPGGDGGINRRLSTSLINSSPRQSGVSLTTTAAAGQLTAGQRVPPIDPSEDLWLLKEEWFHEQIHRNDAEILLNQFPREGTFLVRRSEKFNCPYTLCLYCANRAWKIVFRRRPDGTYGLGTEKPNEKVFQYIRDAINFYSHTPISVFSSDQTSHMVILKYFIAKSNRQVYELRTT